MKKILLFSFLLILAAGLAFAEGIAVLQPAGGVGWPIGSTQKISWRFLPESVGLAQPVNIVLFKDFTLVGYIAKNISCKPDGSGYFNWQVGTLLPDNKDTLSTPKKLAPGKGYRIGVKSADRTLNGESGPIIINE
jgi:hypothetical protein